MNYMSIIKILNADYFQLWFYYKCDFLISTVGNLIYLLSETETFHARITILLPTLLIR